MYKTTCREHGRFTLKYIRACGESHLLNAIAMSRTSLEVTPTETARILFEPGDIHVSYVKRKLVVSNVGNYLHIRAVREALAALDRQYSF